MAKPFFGEDPLNTCGAKTKSDGHPCRRRPVPGRSRCKLHGGRSTGPTGGSGAYGQKLTAAEEALLPALGKALDLHQEMALARLTVLRIARSGPRSFGGSGKMSLKSYLDALDRFLGRTGKLLQTHLQACEFPVLRAKLEHLERALAERDKKWSEWADIQRETLTHRR